MNWMIISDIKKLTKKIKQFCEKRDWIKYHSNSNLAQSISLESAELLELFQWGKIPTKKALSEEVADIAIYLFELADNNKIDLKTAIYHKLAINEQKYPVSKFKGSNKKYNE